MPETQTTFGLTLTIEGGNDAMRTPSDYAAALRKVADHIDGLSPTSVFGGPVADLNGNQVGHYHGAGVPTDFSLSATIEGWVAQARELGRDAGRAAGSWTADGNTTQEHIRRVLKMLEDGDPAAYDFLPREPNLSGEFADDPTPDTLATDLIDLQALADETGEGISWGELADVQEALAEAYEAGVTDTYQDACESTLRAFLQTDN